MTLTETLSPVRPAARASRLQLWIEFVALFVGVPVLMAIFFEEIQQRRALFGTVWLLALLSVVLLWRTPGWRFRQLFRGPVLKEWAIILGFSVATALTCTAFVFAIDPEMFLRIVTYRPELWLMIMVAYPILSAWPQEVIFRSLFFERYQTLFSSTAVLIIVNGLVFGFAHLFYMNWVTISMTAVGGMIMGWAYLRHRSMSFAWVLHAIAGNLVFTIGLGQFFYSGNVG